MAQPKAARFVILGVVVIGALVAIALYAYERSRKEPLVLSGTIEAHNVQVGSLVGGRVLQVAVEEGDRVQPGQLIATLETDNVDRQIAEQEAAIEVARAQLQKTLEGPRREEIERAALMFKTLSASDDVLPSCCNRASSPVSSTTTLRPRPPPLPKSCRSCVAGPVPKTSLPPARSSIAK